MPTDGRGALDGPGAPAHSSEASSHEGGGGRAFHAQGEHSGQQVGGGGGGGGSRKKRRRQRTQRHKGGRRPHIGSSPHGETANRERIYQDIEGLLRQIREAAEEMGGFSENQLVEFAQAVSTLSKTLETEGPLVSDRVFSEYQRVRDRLSQALRNHGGGNGDGRSY